MVFDISPGRILEYLAMSLELVFIISYSVALLLGSHVASSLTVQKSELLNFVILTTNTN